MPLMSWMIGMACSSITTWQNHQDACTHFFEATTKYTQVYQTDEKTEGYVTDRATVTAKENLGTTAVDTVGGVAYTYRVYRNKAVDFKLPNLGICDSVSNRITLDSYTLNLKWNFPWK